MEQFTIKDSTIAFIGLGLIGGSIAKGIKRACPTARIMAYIKKFSRVVVVYCSVIKVLFCCSFQATAFIFYQKPFSLSRTFLTFFKAIWLLFSNKLIYIIISFFICQDFFQFFFFAVSHESALTVYHFRFHLSRTFSSFFGISALFSNW